jgi:hypothetical protein
VHGLYVSQLWSGPLRDRSFLFLLILKVDLANECGVSEEEQ